MSVLTGQKVPDFSAASTGGEISLSALNGRKLVLYFYPKDNTPGCTTEGRDFAAAHGKFDEAGAVILGVSRDSIKSHENFKAKMEYPFDLVADPEEKLCQAFGVMKTQNMYGKQVRGIERSTFVFDKDGRLVKSWRVRECAM